MLLLNRAHCEFIQVKNLDSCKVKVWKWFLVWNFSQITIEYWKSMVASPIVTYVSLIFQFFSVLWYDQNKRKLELLLEVPISEKYCEVTAGNLSFVIFSPTTVFYPPYGQPGWEKCWIIYSSARGSSWDW